MNTKPMDHQQEYQVTARKWRPMEFESVVGQEHVTQTLKNAIRNERLHHAYLFTGPRGVGKTTTARILAKALNCTNLGEDFEPCNECESCQQIVAGRSMDVAEIDGASNNSVEDVRKLRDNAKYPPLTGRYKLYIIDEVHMLSTSAFNALLKTLEEPPKHLIFVFATTEPHKVLPTILSRCQRFDFRRMQISDIVSRLKFIAEREEMEVEEDALVVIAKKADGSMRDSQSIFDQVTSFCGPGITYQQANEALNLIDLEFFFRVTDMMRNRDAAEAFAIVEQIMRTGYDLQEFLIGLAEHFRNFLAVVTTGSGKLIETAKTFVERYDSEAKQLTQGDIVRALHLTLGAQNAIRMASQPRLRLELALIQLALMDSTVSLAELLAKIDGIPEGGGTGSGGGKSAQNAAPGASTGKGASSVASAQPTLSPPPITPAGSGGASPKGASVAESRQSASAAISANPVQAVAKNLADFPLNTPDTISNGGARSTVVNTVVNTVAEPNGAYRAKADDGDVAVLEDEQDYSHPANGYATSTISISDVQMRWKEFVQSCSSKISLLPALDPSFPGEIVGGSVRIYITNDFQRSLLEKNKDILTEKMNEFFGGTFNIEGVIGAPPPVLQADNVASGIGYTNANGKAASPEEEHPFVQGIINLLGATRI